MLGYCVLLEALILGNSTEMECGSEAFLVLSLLGTGGVKGRDLMGQCYLA